MRDTASIAAGHRVIGTISASEDLLVLGRVEGRIQSEATVVVEAAAIIEGDILAKAVIVRGVVVGTIEAVEAIEIAPTAQVAGDLRTRRLTLRPGGRVAGQVASGIEVQGYVSGRRAQVSRVAQPFSTPLPPSAPAWPPEETPVSTQEEVVESASVDEVAETQPSSRRRKRETSREVI